MPDRKYPLLVEPEKLELLLSSSISKPSLETMLLDQHKREFTLSEGDAADHGQALLAGGNISKKSCTMGRSLPGTKTIRRRTFRQPRSFRVISTKS
jgi:hypothetical protein